MKVLYGGIHFQKLRQN